MRRKDWADKISEEVFDMVRNAEDDEDVIKRIAEELRKAYLLGLREFPLRTHREEKHGKVSRYQITLKTVPLEGKVTREYIQEHGKFTYLEDSSLAFEPNPDDVDRSAAEKKSEEEE